MSYTRYRPSRWVTWWVPQVPRFENRETAIFGIRNVGHFTAAELRTDIDRCIRAACRLALGQPVLELEIEELRGYMREFLADVDREYPPDSA